VSFRLKKELELYKEEELELLRETLSSEIHSLQLVTMCFPNTMIEKGKRTKKWSFSLMLLMQSPYIPKELTKACKLFNLKHLLFFFFAEVITEGHFVLRLRASVRFQRMLEKPCFVGLYLSF